MDGREHSSARLAAGGKHSTISAEVRRCRTEAKQATAGPSPHVGELEPLSRVCRTELPLSLVRTPAKRGNSRQPVSLKDNLGINPSTPAACDSVSPRHHFPRPLDWSLEITRSWGSFAEASVQTYELASDLPQPPMESAVATCFEKMEKFLLGHRLLRYTRFESPTQTGIRNWSGVELNQALFHWKAPAGSSGAWVAWKLNRELGRAGGLVVVEDEHQMNEG
ncbi:uncharacterized protein An11g05160 [Aspergillus niger]|uniref:Contig An11c0200, genomic contig n=2 Tax=Aspergillus niger TaxID=5061 RepID=A2QWH4_ASPNC|nr:uncharacterized protein An11g05160 [Aspergillus niger]CAK48415.1 unnamed protein product [Aspergillus niger]